MEAIKFLVSQINIISQEYPLSVIRLGNSNSESDFIVEVAPSELLTKDEKFKKTINSLFLEFFEKYPEESLVFITDLNFIKLTSACYTWTNGETHVDDEINLTFDNLQNTVVDLGQLSEGILYGHISFNFDTSKTSNIVYNS